MDNLLGCRSYQEISKLWLVRRHDDQIGLNISCRFQYFIMNFSQMYDLLNITIIRDGFLNRSGQTLLRLITNLLLEVLSNDLSDDRHSHHFSRDHRHDVNLGSGPTRVLKSSRQRPVQRAFVIKVDWHQNIS